MSVGTKNISSIIAVHSAKGGVGKSTVSVNLAVALARKGARVGLLDADVHGPSASILLGTGEWPDPGKDDNTIQPIEAHGIRFISMGNLTSDETPLIWRGAMVHGTISQLLTQVVWGELDYLIIDMPPGTGDAQLTIAQSVSLDGVLVVSTPQELSLADTIRGISVFHKMQVPLLGMVENMATFVCDGCGTEADLFGFSGAEVLAQELKMPLLGRLPLEPAICAQSDGGTPFVISDPESKASKAIQTLADELQKILASKAGSGGFDITWEKLGWSERVAEPPQERLIEDGPIKALWQVSDDELGLIWPDDVKSLISIRKLRQACPCAACIDEWSGAAILDPESVPSDISLSRIISVGRYALQVNFSDNHNTGIYTFERLRKLFT